MIYSKLTVRRAGLCVAGQADCWLILVTDSRFWRVIFQEPGIDQISWIVEGHTSPGMANTVQLLAAQLTICL